MKRTFLVFFVFPVGLPLIFFLLEPNWLTTPIMFIFVFLVNYFVDKIKCPKFGKRVGLHKYKWGNIEFDMMSPFIKKRCDYCGNSFAYNYGREGKESSHLVGIVKNIQIYTDFILVNRNQ